MAKVQLLTVQSIDGYMIDNHNELPAVLSDEIVKLKDAAIRQLNENASLSMLIDWREKEADSFTYLIEATKETRGIINGMFRMHLIDEIVRYTIPIMLGTGVSLYQQELPKNNWKVVKTASYNDEMSLTVFRKIKQNLLK